MREEVIISTIDVIELRRTKYVQVILPQDAKRIIGVEIGYRIRMKATSFADDSSGMFSRSEPVKGLFYFQVDNNTIIGTVTLRIAGCENIFYREDLLEDINLQHGDFNPGVHFMPYQYARMKGEEVTVDVNGHNKLVEIFYNDLFGRSGLPAAHYKVFVCLWIEKDLP